MSPGKEGFDGVMDRRNRTSAFRVSSSVPAPDSGFTLVEVTICLLILLTLFSLVLPTVEYSLERRALEDLVSQYLADYMYAQSLAIAQSTSTSIQFAPDSHVYTLRRGQTVLKRVAYDTRIQVGSNYGMPRPHEVRFDSRGYVQAGGEILLSGKYQSKRLIIQVTSGRIRVEDVKGVGNG